jgi:hypothetical protein
MEKIHDIDWSYWLKRHKLEDKEILVLTMGLNPDAIDLDTYSVDLHFLEDAPLNLKGARSKYLKRKILLEEQRFERFDYFDDNDWGCYFSATPPGAKTGKVLLKRFLLWLKNEEMGWKLPSELEAYIEKLDKPMKENPTTLIKISEKALKKRGRPPSLTDKKIAELIQMHIDKPTLSHDLLGNEFGVSRKYVGDLFKKKGIN